MGSDPGVERPTLTRHGCTFHLRHKPPSGFCPFCLEPVGMLGNGLARLFGLDFHGCDGSNVMEPEEVRALAVAEAPATGALMGSGRHDGAPTITPAYVDEVIEAAAQATGFRMANDRLGFVPAVLAADRARVEAGREDEVERLRATNRDLHRRAQKAEGQIARGGRDYLLRRLGSYIRKLSAERKRADIAEANLALRDTFIVDRGLWPDFVASLPSHNDLATQLDGRARNLASIAFTAVCGARAYEAQCGDPTGLRHHLNVAGQALADIIAPDPRASASANEPTRKETLQVAAPADSALLRVGAALRSLPSSRRDLDRMGEAIRALPGSPMVGRAIGDG